MKSAGTIAAFYENIRTGAAHDGIPMAEAVSALCASGLRGLYISYESASEYADEIAETLKRTGAEVTGLHAWVTFGENGTEARRVIDRAKDLGTDHALIVPVCEDNDIGTLIAGMRDAVSYGKTRGVRVYMEDLDQSDSPYNSVNGLRTFLERVPGLNCCFDTGNWIMHREDEVEAFRQFRGRIGAMHLKDRRAAPGNADDEGVRILDGTFRYPAPVGKGDIRIAEILSMAEDWPVIVEMYGYSPGHMLEGIRESVEWIKGE
ncbi:MAG: sugar phosphate isomerase/epimerase [Clostridia bacterium]|nr:sugar phosphate isomerase/epimerase [Clostridia bacterium]